MSKSFARIIIASDGEEVLFVVDRDPATKGFRIQGVACTDNDDRISHAMIYENPDNAYNSLAIFGVQEADVLRQMAAMASKTKLLS